ncbi:Hemin receptor [Polaribacter huanghezhanensis]|uniref:TonB-dependent receptor n=1 Tax=Polaribacter huanghezhanensis TaxID=1354726 RepID=UPI002648AA19|nr:TonB-dependent receptor [Polaribacter huanghezhanensis]WKD85725.1 Hemin receptor [Polaribacter huanghezhanensis]
MKKMILSYWLFIGIIAIANAQIVTITDAEDGSPLEFVTLSHISTHTFATTNAKGQAAISELNGLENIEIRLLGYKTLVKSYDQIQQSNFKIQLEATNISLDQVVISASRWRQSSSNIPIKIATISAKDIAFQNPQTAADLLSVSGKVYVQKSQQGGGSPMIRGFATNRLLYTVDGVRMNTAIFRGGNLQNVINIDPFATEKTEVLFGPGSVIYGSDAIGGVMSFQTLTPQESLSDKTLITGKAITRFSSANNEQTQHFDVNVGWKKWAIVTSLSSWNYGHLRQGSHGPKDYIKDIYVERQGNTDVIITQQDPLLQIPTAYSQINMMQKIRFTPNEKWDLQFGFHYSETSPYGRYDRNNRFKNGTLRYAEWSYGPQKWIMNNLSINYKVPTTLYDEMSLRLAQQFFEESRMDRSLNKNNRSINTENVEAYSVNLDFTKVFSEKHTFFYGTEYIFDDVKSVGVVSDLSTDTETTGPSRYPNATWSSFAVYVNDEFKVSEKFTASAGLRYNQFAIDADFTNNLAFYPFPFSKAKLNKESFTGSIGGVYRPSKSFVLSANFGTAFRSPNIDDIGKVFDSEAGGVTVPNPDLEAEYAYNIDVGIAKVFNDVVKVDVTGYYTKLQNAMVKRDFKLNGLSQIMYDGQLSQVQAIQNAAVANVYGVQAGLEIKFPAGFSFSTDLNYQVGEEELDDGSTSPSRHAAPFYGISRLNFNANKLHLQLYATYMAERKFEDLPFGEKSKVELYAKDGNGNNYAPAWQTFNIKANYNISKNFTVSSGIENLLDTRYRPYSSGISAPGRNLIFSLRANF